MKCSACNLSGGLGFALVLLAAVIGIRAIAGSSVAPMPAVFDPNVTFEEASERAASSDKPVLVFATADWCGPCQTFKRGALKDAAVIDLITTQTEPVYVDIDEHPELASSLGVQGIPAVIIVRDGKVTAHISGAVSAPALLTWLDRAVSDAS